MDSCQVADDNDLLELMLTEQSRAPSVFQTTNYWKNYEAKFIEYLRTHGLKHFRSGNYAPGGEVLKSFGAADDVPTNDSIGLRALVKGLASLGLTGKSRALSARFQRPLEGAALDEYLHKCFVSASQARLGSGALSIEQLSISGVGSPGAALSRDGRLVTESGLYYYLRYAYLSQFVNFSELRTVVELSSGSGKQAEILAKLHPELSLILLDIPPQLYVAHQYLSSVFPDRVQRFDPELQLDEQFRPTPGRIYLLGNWQIDAIRRFRHDLFWSSASLGEMEPDVAGMYLAVANSLALNVYLMQKMDGKERARKRGEHGVLEPVTFAHYTEFLRDFELIDRCPAVRPNGRSVGPGYEDSYWSRV